MAKASWEVLKADKELLLLPVISTAAGSLMVATSFVPLLILDTPLASSLILGALYFVLAYITIFFNAALISAAHERLEGGNPTVGSALRGAASRAGRILPWAIISAVVSVILKAIGRRTPFLGRILIRRVGVAWSVVTFLVLPVIVMEAKGAREAVRHSRDLLRNTWGEHLVTQVGFRVIGLLSILPGVALILTGVGVGGAAVLPLLTIGILWMVLVAVVISTISGIIQAALYHYATDDRAQSEHFNSESLTAAFRMRRRRLGL